MWSKSIYTDENESIELVTRNWTKLHRLDRLLLIRIDNTRLYMIIVAACWWKEKQSEVHWEFTEHIFLYIHEELMRKRNQTNSQSQVCDFLYLLIRIQSQVGFEPTPAPTEYELWCALLAFILTKLSVLLQNSLFWILILIAMQLFLYFKSLLKNKHICLSGFFLELHPASNY